jgi:biotin carboxyl carrier protein
MKGEFKVGDAMVETSVEKTADGWIAIINAQPVILRSIGRNLFSAQVNGKQLQIAALKYKDTYYLDIDSVLIEVTEAGAENFASSAGSHGAKDKIFAPMPGKVVKVLVKVGDDVTEKQPLVIVEAMKMENNVVSAAKGKVKTGHFQSGDQVGTDQPIIELEIQQ